MGGVTESALNEAQLALRVLLPADYRAFMTARDGFEGFLGGAFLCIHSLADMVELNRATADLQRATCPGLVYFGSDGSREGLGWDYRQDPPPVVMVDITIAGWHDALIQAADFATFMHQIEHEGVFRWQ